MWPVAIFLGSKAFWNVFIFTGSFGGQLWRWDKPVVNGTSPFCCSWSFWAWRIQLILRVRGDRLSLTLGFHWEFSLSTCLTSVFLFTRSTPGRWMGLSWLDSLGRIFGNELLSGYISSALPSELCPWGGQGLEVSWISSVCLSTRLSTLLHPALGSRRLTCIIYTNGLSWPLPDPPYQQQFMVRWKSYKQGQGHEEVTWAGDIDHFTYPSSAGASRTQYIPCVNNHFIGCLAGRSQAWVWELKRGKTGGSAIPLLLIHWVNFFFLLFTSRLFRI